MARKKSPTLKKQQTSEKTSDDVPKPRNSGILAPTASSMSKLKSPTNASKNGSKPGSNTNNAEPKFSAKQHNFQPVKEAPK